VEYIVTDSKTSLPPADKKAALSAKPKKNLFSNFLSIVTLILLGACAFYFWQQQNQQTLQIQQILSSSQSNSQSLRSFQNNYEVKINSLNDLSDKQQTLLNSLAQESYFHTQKLADLGARSRTDWLLAEAEYLMHLANQRLTLEQDINSAEAMLTSADKIIEEINDPGLFEIRQALANEIVSLQQISHLDYQGLYLKLNALISSLDKLKQTSFLRENTSEQKIENSTEVKPESTNQALAIWKSIWSDLKQAVSIRRLDQPVEPLLAPEQDYYLKQNLRLMLEQASLALIDKNTIIYQSSLSKALSWMNRYFSQDDKQVLSLQNSIADMSAFKIDQDLPDISKSLRLTKTKIESFYKQHSITKLSTPDSEIEATNTKQGPAL
jgi:uroporphyrin-3 C-methyltransferase